MFESYILISTVLFIGMGIALFAALFPLLLILHFIYKKKLDPLYFNEAHFSTYELSIFNSFPLLLIKVITYIRAIVLPGTMQNRFKNNILKPKENPVIYALSLISFLIIAYCGLVLINTVIMGIFFYTNQ